jgi:hypothetical protein
MISVEAAHDSYTVRMNEVLYVQIETAVICPVTVTVYVPA